jgi:hypothetical protein
MDAAAKKKNGSSLVFGGFTKNETKNLDPLRKVFKKPTNPMIISPSAFRSRLRVQTVPHDDNLLERG